MKMVRFSRLVLCAALLMGAWVPAAHGEVYRYEKDGQVFYGDRMPSANHQSGHSVLNKQGVVFEEVLSRDEQRQIASALKKAEQNELRDRALLDTFGNEDDLVLARNRRLAMLDIQIAQIDGRAASLCDRTNDLKDKIKVRQAGSEAGKVPDALLAQLSQARLRFNSTLVVLNEKMIERNNMATQFVSDLNRYRELKAQR